MRMVKFGEIRRHFKCQSGGKANLANDKYSSDAPTDINSSINSRFQSRHFSPEGFVQKNALQRCTVIVLLFDPTHFLYFYSDLRFIALNSKIIKCLFLRSCLNKFCTKQKNTGHEFFIHEN